MRYYITYCVDSILFPRGKEVGREADTDEGATAEDVGSVTADTDSANLPALNCAICFRNSSSCWLHL